MTTSPAEELRAAAALLRERASHATEGPWAIWRDLDHQGFITVGDAAGALTPERPTTEECNPVAHVYAQEDADFIATMHPGVGLALASLLERQANIAAEMQQFLGSEFQDGALDQDAHDALAVARQINTGGTP